MFKALVLNQVDGKTVAGVKQISTDDLPEADVLIAVEYTSLNYKDGMAVTGTGKIVRDFPMVPGVDFAGKVLESGSDRFQVGDPVILTGWGVGERHWGGYAQQARVKSEWLVGLPDGLDSRRAMTVGTAGLTAMLCVMTLEDAGITPDKGPILVTGAAGGVGSVSVSLLHQLGYEVAALTGRDSTHDFLKGLGASHIVSRDELNRSPKPLEKQRWAGGVDTVGGDILATLLAETDYNGAVAACGLAASFKLNMTVMPFILRNVSLCGVDSVFCPIPRREEGWRRLAELLPESAYADIGQVASLEEVPDAAARIMKGQVQGRVLIDPNK
ncbi:MAG: oxidoreductase [Gammaproteobacteria bacterium]|nr:oxidoreductase [Gammaproteobacteria bacterium]